MQARIALVIVALLWGFSFLYANEHCSVFAEWCPGPEVEAWFLPLFLAPFGLPAALGLIVIGGVWLFRRFQKWATCGFKPGDRKSTRDLR
jgi:hypothetical protein